MPPWSFLSIARALAPSVAECDGDPALATFLADPAISAIELEAGCDHVVPINTTIHRSLAITGQAGARPRLVFSPGASNSNLFQVVGATFTLSNLDLYGGADVSPHGRGIWAHTGATVTLDQVDVYAFSFNSHGGAMHITDATLDVLGGTFSDNVGLWGGHFWVGGGAMVTVDGTHLERTYATGGGGAAYVETGGTLQLFDVVAEDHEAPYGGFLATRGTVVADGFTSSFHEATNSHGGAFHIENGNGSLLLCDATLSEGSTPNNGGSISAYGPLAIGVGCPRSQPDAGATFIGHSAQHGGAIYAQNTTVTIGAPTALVDHTATASGGAIHLNNVTASLSHVSIDGASADTTGGGLFATNCPSLALTDVQVADAHAGSDGGGVCVVNSAEGATALTDVTLSDNSSGASGGGLYAGSDVDVVGLTVSGCLADNHGGGVFFTGDAQRVLDDTLITDSFAGIDGGGLNLRTATNSTLSATGLTVLRSDALNGGAVALRDADATFVRFHLEDGFASDGGAFLASGPSAVELRNGMVCASASGTAGVSLRANASNQSPDLQASQVAFVANTGVRGGGLDLDGTTTFGLSGLHFVGNQANLGAAVNASSTTSGSLTDVVVAANDASVPTSAALDGLLAIDPWYDGNTPLASTADPSAVDTPAGLLFDGSCTWAALRTVDRSAAHGVWSTVVPGDTASWPTLDDPFRDDDGDSVPWIHDCDDADASRHHGADELCDGYDNDCDGRVDDEDDDVLTNTTWYRDADRDQYGTEEDATTACVAPEGYVAVAGDCDDDDPTAQPLPFYRDDDHDGIGTGPVLAYACIGKLPPGASFQEDDCDDDDPSVQGPQPSFADLDLDGHGDQVEVGRSCPGTPGLVRTNDDCDDRRSDVFPGATEVCDGVDQDCDEEVDEGVLLEVWTDADGDGFGVGEPSLRCDPGAGALIDGDCNDTDPSVALDCDPGTATHTGTSTTTTTTTGDGPPAGDPGEAGAGCACSGAPRPAALLPALLLLPLLRRRVSARRPG